MIIFFKNFKRTDRTLLSIQSVRHLYPNIEIYCLNLFINNKDEYSDYINLFNELNVKVFYGLKKYNFESSAEGSKNNGLYFTEGINKMYQLSSDKTKVLMLDEDSFFTSGETIKFLLENEFDLAYGVWPAPDNKTILQINGSIIAFNCVSTKSIFPINEYVEYIENLLGNEVYEKCLSLGLKTIPIPTRNYTNYGNDGVHTNDINKIREELTKSKIPFKQ
jgi:hypothetical protein